MGQWVVSGGVQAIRAAQPTTTASLSYILARACPISRDCSLVQPTKRSRKVGGWHHAQTL